MSADLQTPFDASVVMVTIVRDSFAQALRSVFAQAFAGRIQVLVGVDRWAGDRAHGAGRGVYAQVQGRFVARGGSRPLRGTGGAPRRSGMGQCADYDARAHAGAA